LSPSFWITIFWPNTRPLTICSLEK